MERTSSAWRPPAGDAVLALAFAALGVSLATGTVDDHRPVAASLLAVAHALPLAWRRRRPEAALALMGATGIAAAVAGFPPVILGPAILPAVHGLGAVRRRERAIPVLAAVLAVMAVVVTAGDNSAGTTLGNAVGITMAWWLGDRHRTSLQRAHDAEAEAELRARQAVADERLRIARELHDVVAHALSVIAVQAGTGRVVLASDPGTAAAALRAIETESRDALGEMRRLLAVLRSDEEGDGPLRPSPGLGDLDGLVAAAVRSGLAVDVREDGERTPLPAGVDLAAYRIVQEALTNVRRHAGATAAEVRVLWRPDAVEVEVVDNGRGAPVAAPAGNGLVGMRERAAIYGGTLEFGDRPGGGFRVAARLPAGSRS